MTCLPIISLSGENQWWTPVSLSNCHESKSGAIPAILAATIEKNRVNINDAKVK